MYLFKAVVTMVMMMMMTGVTITPPTTQATSVWVAVLGFRTASGDSVSASKAMSEDMASVRFMDLLLPLGLQTLCMQLLVRLLEIARQLTSIWFAKTVQTRQVDHAAASRT